VRFRLLGKFVGFSRLELITENIQSFIKPVEKSILDIALNTSNNDITTVQIKFNYLRNH